MDPAKRAPSQNAGEVSSLQWFFPQSVELMMDKVWLHCIRPLDLHILASTMPLIIEFFIKIKSQFGRF